MSWKEARAIRPQLSRVQTSLRNESRAIKPAEWKKARAVKPAE